MKYEFKFKKKKESAKNEKRVFFTVRLSELSCVMPPEFMIKVAKLDKPDVCSESRLLLLLLLLFMLLFMLLLLLLLFCAMISFSLLRPNTKKVKIKFNGN